jgi:aldehyde dehydrogenase (NAD+)
MDTQTLGHFIGGEWTSADGALESRNPSNTDDVVARFPDGGAEEVGQAVAAASDAFAGWANASPEVRSDLLHKVGEKLFERSAELGELLAREEGKTRAEGVGETLRAARIFRYFAGEALRRHGQTLESTRPGLDVATYREALRSPRGRPPRRWPSVTPWS